MFCHLPKCSWSTSEERGWRRATDLSPSVKYFTDESKGELLLWIICVIYVMCLSCFRVCSLLTFGHLLGKGRPLVCDVWLLFCHFLVWYPGSGVVLLIADLCHLSYFKAFPCGVLGQVWYMIVSIPDICLLPFLK